MGPKGEKACASQVPVVFLIGRGGEQVTCNLLLGKFIERLVPVVAIDDVFPETKSIGKRIVAPATRGVGVALEWITWFSVVPLIALAIVLPISINGVGIREGGMVFLLGQWGVAEEKAVAVGLLWFFATIVTGLFGGVLFLIDRQSTKSVLADTTSRS